MFLIFSIIMVGFIFFLLFITFSILYYLYKDRTETDGVTQFFKNWSLSIAILSSVVSFIVLMFGCIQFLTLDLKTIVEILPTIPTVSTTQQNAIFDASQILNAAAFNVKPVSKSALTYASPVN